MRPTPQLPRACWVPIGAVGLCVGAASPALAGLLGIAAALAAPALSLRSRRVALAAALLGIGCAAGSLDGGTTAERTAPSVGTAPLRYRGVVEETSIPVDPDGGRPFEMILRLDRPPPASGLAHGARIRVAVWRGEPDVAIGDRLELVVAAREPRSFCNGGVDPYAAAAERRGIAADASLSDSRSLWRAERRGFSLHPARLGNAWRARTQQVIRQALSPLEAGVVRALVLGDQAEVDPDVRTAFARTGTIHVLSVSGLHVAMVAAAALGLTSALAARIPWLVARVSARRAGAVAAMPAVAGYAWMTSPAPPILRAAVMAELFLVALALRRRFHFPTALGLAAVAVGIALPGAVVDVSAQLSFATVLWIWAGFRLVRSAVGPARWAEWRRRARTSAPARLAAALVVAVATSALATLGAAPLLAWYFGEVSLIGLLANPIVVPLMGPGALGAGLVGMALAPIAPAAAGLAFQVSGWCVRLAVAVASELAEWPLAVVPVAWEPASIISVAVAAAALPAPRYAIRSRRALAAGTLIGAIAFGAASAPVAPALRASFLDVGQGDAALVELPHVGARWLVDGGGLARGREPGARVLLPALRRRRIDRLEAAIVSHPEWDHFGGISTIVREGRTREVWWTGRGGDRSAWRRFVASAARHGVPLVEVGPTRPPRGRAARAVEMLHPRPAFRDGSANEGSLVFRVRYGATSLLFTGDIERRAEGALVRGRRDWTATVLKVPHHGSGTSSSAGFVDAAGAAVAVASLGRSNRFGFPAAAVVERYRRRGAAWLGTDRAGEVVVESDGQRVRLTRCRRAAAATEPARARW